MKRITAGLLAFVAIGLLASACDDEGSFRERRLGGYGGGNNPQCGQYTTCGTCTPALGCGWCFVNAQTGVCLDSTADCPSNAEGWTWDPPGCSGGAEAGVTRDGSVLADASVGGNGDATSGGGNDASPASDAGSDAQADGD
jgi:hypothetical protein